MSVRSEAQQRCIVLDGSTAPPRELIGGKARSLARMRQLGLTVPPAFVLTTEVCRAYHQGGGEVPDEVWDDVRRGVGVLEEQTDRTFGGAERPLLLSVRSGSAVSMPGMMDTVLNLGINDDVEQAIAREAGDAAYAADSHRRFVQQYGRIVLRALLEPHADDVTAGELRAEIAELTGAEVPSDPWAQLRGAVAAVFASWNTARAKAYRRHWKISDDLGTAVTVQAMVFGNHDDRSGTGVLFTRNPLSGAPEPYGEYLPGGQGEDVVSGERDPLHLDELAVALPAVHGELLEAGSVLEREARDAQDIEFTVEQGRLFLLQSRTAKRSPQAAVRMAVDLVADGLIDVDEALRRVTSEQVRTLLRPRLVPGAAEGATVLASGEAACPGLAVGRVVTDPDEAGRSAAAGEDVVLLRPSTSPEDVHGMIAAVGVITATGGSTSHAAVVSRALGRPCVVGCGQDVLDAATDRIVTVDGEAGVIYDGSLPAERVDETADPALRQLTEWAAERCPVEVRPMSDERPAGVRDLDATGVEDPGEVTALVDGAEAVAGRILESDEGVQAAVAGGARVLYVDMRLPAMLAALPAHGQDT